MCFIPLKSILDFQTSLIILSINLFKSRINIFLYFSKNFCLQGENVNNSWSSVLQYSGFTFFYLIWCESKWYFVLMCLLLLCAFGISDTELNRVDLAESTEPRPSRADLALKVDSRLVLVAVPAKSSPTRPILWTLILTHLLFFLPFWWSSLFFLWDKSFLSRTTTRGSRTFPNCRSSQTLYLWHA